MRTVWHAAKDMGRTVIYDSRLAYLLLYLNETQPFVSNLLGKGDFEIYLDRLKMRGEERYTETFRMGRRLHEKSLLESLGRDDRFIWGPEGRRRILDCGNEYLLCTSYGISMLLQLKEAHRDINGVFVYGRSEPYDEEAEITFRKLQNWIRVCNMDFDVAHTSGHVSQEKLATMVEVINPALTIPIHTEYPELFKKFTSRLHIPQLGETYTL